MRQTGRARGRGERGGETKPTGLWELGPWLLAAAVLRIWTVASLARDLRIIDPVFDSRYYFDLAQRLSLGQGWPSDPLFFGALYPALLSGLFRLAPAQPLTVQIAQSVLGLISLVLLFVAVRRCFGRTAAHASAALYTLSGPILAIENVVLMESVMLFLATTALWLWSDRRFGSVQYPLIALAFGIVSGLMSVGRASFLLLPLAALLLPVNRLWSLAATRPTPATGRYRLLVPALIILGTLLPLIPQTIHQSRATGQFQFLTLNGGINFYIGNNPHARGIFSDPPDSDFNDDFTARRAASIQVGRELTLAESSRYWMRRGLDFIRQDPQDALRLFARKALLFFAPREIPQLYTFDALADVALPLQLALVRGAWILPLAALGILAVARQGTRRGKPRPAHGGRTALVPWLTLIGIVWLQMIVFFATGRYRIIAWPALLGLAGAGVAYGIAELRTRRWLPLSAVALVILLLHLTPPSYPAEKARAFDAYTVGLRQTQRGNLSEGLAWYRQAIEISPNYGEAWHGMGSVYYQMARLPDAVRAYHEALQRMPQSAITHYALGVTYHQMGKDQQAIVALQNAVRLNPRNTDYRNHLGLALARVGRFDEAANEWRAVLRLDPDHRGAHENLRRIAERLQ